MPAIECVGLSRHFGEVEAVREVSFEVGEGEFFALLGPNGAGKTTTMQMIATILTPTSGQARVMGHDVVREAPRVREMIGMVFQEPALDDRLTARENLSIHAALYRIPRGDAASRVEEALEWAALSEASKRPLRTFSGGMKRRLELARALMHRPGVLFMDEPTLGLDPQGRRHLWDRIADLRHQGLTVFMTTHYLPEAEACDRVGIIDQGQLVAVDSPAALKRKVMGSEEGDLEEVFISLTGRQLRDEVAGGRDQMISFARRGGEHTR